LSLEVFCFQSARFPLADDYTETISLFQIRQINPAVHERAIFAAAIASCERKSIGTARKKKHPWIFEE